LHSPRAVSADERILHAHWQWSRRHAMLRIIATIMIFASIFAMLEIMDAGEGVRTGGPY
jgi:hypothetical protein